jgi:hypothetical protein
MSGMPLAFELGIEVGLGVGQSSIGISSCRRIDDAGNGPDGQ